MSRVRFPLATYAYDGVGRQVRMLDALGRRTTSGYDAAGRLTLRLDGRGLRSSYAYDAAGRVVGQRNAGGTRVTLAYDPAGRRVLLSDATGRTTSTYDAAGRLRGATNPAGLRLTYSYDAAGRRTGLSDPDGGRFTYAYDPASRMTQLANPQNERATWVYDAAGQKTLQRLANGTQATYTYDAAGRLTRLANLRQTAALPLALAAPLGGGLTVLSSFGYGYDPVGVRTRVAEADGSRVTWSYDAADRLTRELRTGSNAFTLTHTYDPADNRLVKTDGGLRTTFAYDAANQLLTQQDAAGRTTFLYDANGNQTGVQAPAGRTTQVWDGDNQLTRVLLPTGVRNTYTYNGVGQRVQRQDTGGTAGIVWDGEAVLRETSAGALLSQYTVQPGQFGLLLAQRRSAVSQFYHLDGLGSAAQLTNSSQAVTDQYGYEAYGALRSSTGSSVNPYRYVGGAGYYFDPDTANYWLRAREYAPVLARFMSADPLAFVVLLRNARLGGINLYQYAQLSPLTLVDPSGLQEPLPIPIEPLGPPLRIFVPAPPAPVAPLPPSFPPPVLIGPPPGGVGEPRPVGPNPAHFPPDNPLTRPWRCPGNGRRPDSDCTPDKLDRYNALVENLCKMPAPPACSSLFAHFWSCMYLERAIDLNEQCAMARKAREFDCFRGGDMGHRIAIALIEYQVSHCYYQLRVKQCPGYESPPAWLTPQLV